MIIAESMEKFRCLGESTGNIRKVRLYGCLDQDTRPILKNYLDDLINKGNYNILVDMKGLDYISSAGIGTFLGVLKELRKYGGDILFLNVKPSVYNVLELVGLTKICKVFSDEEKALKEFHKGMLAETPKEDIKSKQWLQPLEELEKRLSSEVDSLRGLSLETVTTLADAVDARVRYTYGHSQGVAKYALAIAEKLRFSREELKLLKYSCHWHDLGKVAVSNEILTKKGVLTGEEWDEVKLHPDKGADMLEDSGLLPGLSIIVRHHHERYDGAGYPRGLREEEIPAGARIIAVADAFQAMTSERPHRRRRTKEEARTELKSNSGIQFDPEMVKTFLEVV